jgi:hypothetical protein
MRGWTLAGIALACAGGLIALLPAEGSPTLAADAGREQTTEYFEGRDRIALTKEGSQKAVAAGLVPEGASSLLRLQRTLKYGEFVWNDQGVAEGPVTVHVDLRRQLVSVFRDGQEIGAAVTLYGADGHETPAGRFPILVKIQDHWSATYDAPMPYTLRLTEDGVAVHGSDVRPGKATHGCVGVPVEFARRLFEQVDTGDIVEIVYSEARRA